MDCGICLNTYTKKLRQKIVCQYCPEHACKECQQQYLLKTYEDPHCYSCKRGWSSDFMVQNFPLSFRNNTLRLHRRTILFEREKSLLPAMQIFVEAKRNIERVNIAYNEAKADFVKKNEKFNKLVDEVINYEKDIWNDLLDKKTKGQITNANKLEYKNAKLIWKFLSENRLKYYNTEYRQAKNHIGEVFDELIYWQNMYSNGTGGAERHRREFMMCCPAEKCRGFLSTSYKCGVCDKYTCSECLEVLGLVHETTLEAMKEAHKCKADNIESAKLIKKETRPCPKCGARIFKIDGCFAENTQILMWNGEIKLSQNIITGDELIGDDGNKRIVETTCSGEDEMYEVTQTRGNSYIVNSKHKLALKPCNTISARNNNSLWIVRWFNGDSFSSSQFTLKEDAENFLNQMNLPEVVEIEIGKYMNLSQATKNSLYGYKTNIINWPHKDVRLDPYLMGVWLGDGINNGVDFACNAESDPEIVQYLLKWCNLNGCELVHDDIYRFRVRRAGLTQGRDAINHGATSINCKGCIKKKCELCDLPNIVFQRSGALQSKNPLKATLESYNLIRNKHIPNEYIVNDRETRLQLLAGLIDTDGHLANNGKRIQISQANHSIAKQIALVARSLGFVVSINIIKKNNVPFPGKELKNYPPHLGLSISGTNLSDIPTLIKRKKCFNSTPNKDWFKTSISVKSIGKGTYYGWSVNKNKRFIMEDMTVLRNCDQMYCTNEGCHTAFSWDSGHIVTGRIHNPHYYEWLRRNGGEAPREMGDIPCGGIPDEVIFMRSILRNNKLTNNEKNHILEIHRNIYDIEARLTGFPARPPALLNKEHNVAYLMNKITEDAWKRRLELTEAAFNRKKEIGQLLQTFIIASIDILQNIARKLEDPSKSSSDIACYIKTTSLPNLESLRNYTNESYRLMAKSRRMAVPQIGDRWQWLGVRALYKPEGPKNTVIETETDAITETISPV